MTSRGDGFSLHVGGRGVNHHEERDGNQRWASRRIRIGFEVPRAGDAFLLVRQRLRVIVRMRSGKDDGDAEVKQRQRQA